MTVTEITDSVRPLQRWTKPAQLDPIDPPAPYPIRYHADEVAPDVYPEKPAKRSLIELLIDDAIFLTVWGGVFMLASACLIAAVLACRWVAK